MPEITRELVAYSLLAVTFLGGGLVSLRMMRQRKRVALRRRGIKTYGH